MAMHCPYCDSSNIEARVGPPPNNVHYYHCNACNRNFITPVVDPLVVGTADEAADAVEQDTKE